MHELGSETSLPRHACLQGRNTFNYRKKLKSEKKHTHTQKTDKQSQRRNPFLSVLSLISYRPAGVPPFPHLITPHYALPTCLGHKNTNQNQTRQQQKQAITQQQPTKTKPRRTETQPGESEHNPLLRPPRPVCSISKGEA